MKNNINEWANAIAESFPSITPAVADRLVDLLLPREGGQADQHAA